MFEMQLPSERASEILAEQDPVTLQVVIEGHDAEMEEGNLDQSGIVNELALGFSERVIDRGITTTDPATANEAFALAAELLNGIDPSAATQHIFRNAQLWKILLPVIRARRMEENRPSSILREFHTQLADWLDDATTEVDQESGRDLLMMGIFIGEVSLMHTAWVAYPLPNQISAEPRYLVETEAGAISVGQRPVAARKVVGIDWDHDTKTDDPVELARHISAALRGSELSAVDQAAIQAMQSRHERRIVAAISPENADRDILPSLEVRPTGTKYDTYRRLMPTLGYPLALAEHVDPDVLAQCVPEGGLLRDISVTLEQALASGDEALFAMVDSRLRKVLAVPYIHLAPQPLMTISLWNAYMPGFRQRVRREAVSVETVTAINDNMIRLYNEFSFPDDNIGQLGIYVTMLLFLERSLQVSTRTNHSPITLFYPSTLRETANLSDGSVRYNHTGYMYNARYGYKIPLLMTATQRGPRRNYHEAVRKLILSDIITGGVMGRQHENRADQQMQLWEVADILVAHMSGRLLSTRDEVQLANITARLNRFARPLRKQEEGAGEENNEDMASPSPLDPQGRRSPPKLKLHKPSRRRNWRT